MGKKLSSALFVTTSSRRAEIALLNTEMWQVMAHQEPRHDEFLFEAVEELLNQFHLQLGNLETLVIDIGPGSFTGIRIAVGLARTWGWATQKKILPLTSFDCLISENPHATVVRMIDGLNGFVYVLWRENPMIFRRQEFFDWLKELSPKPFLIGNIEWNQKEIQEFQKHNINFQKAFPSVEVMKEHFLKSERSMINWWQLQAFYLKDSTPSIALSQTHTKS